MKPDDLFDPANFPDDLKWVTAHYRLHPSDPVYLLLAWHWRRVKQSEDTLKAAIVELKAALDSRLATLEQGTEGVARINEALGEFHSVLEPMPAQLGAQMENKLTQPISNAITQLRTLEKTIAPLTATFAASQRRQILAALLAGVCLGVLSAVILFLR